MSPSNRFQPVPAMTEKDVTAVKDGNLSSERTSQVSGQDSEKQAARLVPELKRKLKARHLQMIAIGMRF